MHFLLKTVVLFLVTAVSGLIPGVYAQGHITVSGTAESNHKQSISFAGLTTDHSLAANEFVSVLRNDLQISGYFLPTDREQTAVSLSGVVRGGAAGISAEITASWLLGVRSKSWKQQSSATTIRDAAHAMADTLIEEVAGKKSMASSRILCVGRTATGTEIYVCDADGARLQKLTSDNALCLSPNWQPHANVFLYTSWLTGSPAVYSINRDTMRRKRISSRPGMNQGATYSPFGDKIAVILSHSGAVDLYLMDAQTRRILERLTKTKKANESSPAWSPDGRSLVYVSDESGVPRCYVMDLATKQARRLIYTAGIRENIAPEWNQENQIAFCGRSQGRYRIYTTNAGKDPRVTQPVQVSPEDGADYEDPSWAPDGRHIVCTRTFNYHRCLVVLDTLGDPPRTLFSKVSGDWYLPSWSDNGIAEN